MNNLQDVFAYLDTLNNREELNRRNWEQELYLSYPELSELEKKKKDLMIRRLKDIMDSPLEKDRIVGESEQEINSINAKIADIKQKRGIPEYKEIFVCGKCHGTGYVGNELCSCVRRIAYKELFGAKTADDISYTYDDFDSSIFEDTDQMTASEYLKRNLMMFSSDYPNNRIKNIIFSGAPGLGKTYNMENLVKMLSEKEDDICFISSYRLFEVFHRDRLGDFDDLKLIYDAKIIAIDDLGSEPITQNVTKEYFFDFLNYRIDKGLYTFIATNNDIYQIQERYSGRVASRLKDDNTCIFIKMEGKDLRVRS